MRCAIGLSLFALVGLVGCGPSGPPAGAHLDPKTTEAEFTALTGTWVYERQVVEGKEVPVAEMGKGSIVISPNTMVTHIFRADGQPLNSIRSRLFIDPTTEPKQMDNEWSMMLLRKSRHVGIYKLEGDRLTYCRDNTGKQRPTTFDSPPGTPFVLSILRRQGK